VSAKTSSMIPDSTGKTPNNTAATGIDGPGQTNTATPRARTTSPNASLDFHRCRDGPADGIGAAAKEPGLP